MGFIISIKTMITRAVGPKKWNEVLQSGGWKKYVKKEPEVCRKIQENSQYKGIHKGERCFIIGNGPSLKTQDLTKLKEEYVFTCNQIMRNPVYPELNSNFHFFADSSFFNLNRENAGDMEVFELMKQINTNGNKPVVFFASEGYRFSQDFSLTECLDLHYFTHRLELTDPFAMEIDFSKFVPNLHTVVHYAIAMAIYMGFSEIYLLGCDCTNVITAVNTRLNDGDGAEYAYQISENEKKRMQKRNSSINLEDELKSFSEVFRAYRVFGEYASKHGIQLINCTDGGLLDCLPRARYEDIVE